MKINKTNKLQRLLNPLHSNRQKAKLKLPLRLRALSQLKITYFTNYWTADGPIDRWSSCVRVYRMKLLLSRLQ